MTCRRRSRAGMVVRRPSRMNERMTRAGRYDANMRITLWAHILGLPLGLLRGQLGFTGVSITDSLTGTAKARGIETWRLAVRAARAGTDMILVTNTEAATREIYSKLMTWSANGSISKGLLQASYDRILALKAGL